MSPKKWARNDSFLGKWHFLRPFFFGGKPLFGDGCGSKWVKIDSFLRAWKMACLRKKRSEVPFSFKMGFFAFFGGRAFSGTKFGQNFESFLAQFFGVRKRPASVKWGGESSFSKEGFS